MSNQAHTQGDANTRATEHLRYRVAIDGRPVQVIAESIGKNRMWLYDRLAGNRAWKANDLDLMAEALRVPKADLWFGVSRAVAS